MAFMHNIFNNLIQPTRFTSSARVNNELQQIIAHILNDFVASWYSFVSEDDKELFSEILLLLSSITKECEKRLKNIDWVLLLSCQLPYALKRHLHDFRHCRAKVGTSYAGGKTLEELFRGAQPHFALVSSSATSDNEAEYLRRVVELILELILPPEELKSDIVKFLLREILSYTVLLKTVDRICDPDFINQLILRSLSDEQFDDTQPFLNDLTAGDEFTTSSSLGHPSNINIPFSRAATNVDFGNSPSHRDFSNSLNFGSSYQYNQGSLRFRMQSTFLKRRRKPQANNVVNLDTPAQIIGVTPAGMSYGGVGITTSIFNRLTFGGLEKVTSGMEKIKNMVKDGSVERPETGKERAPKTKRFSKRKNTGGNGISLRKTRKGKKTLEGDYSQSRTGIPEGWNDHSEIGFIPGGIIAKKSEAYRNYSGDEEMNLVGKRSSRRKKKGKIQPITPISLNSINHQESFDNKKSEDFETPMLKNFDSKHPLTHTPPKMLSVELEKNDTGNLPTEEVQTLEMYENSVNESDSSSELTNIDHLENTDTQSDASPLNFSSSYEESPQPSPQLQVEDIPSEENKASLPDQPRTPESQYHTNEYETDFILDASPIRNNIPTPTVNQNNPMVSIFNPNTNDAASILNSNMINESFKLPDENFLAKRGWWELIISIMFLAIQTIVNLLLGVFVWATGRKTSGWDSSGLESAVVAVISTIKDLWILRQETIEGPQFLGPIDTTKYKDLCLEEPVLELLNELFLITKRGKWVLNQIIFFLAPIAHGLFRNSIN
ncbi:hypothetical protein HK096_004388, partial [Nowakowskiella sp. JEL0078]